MQPTVYQKPEIRDANDNIIQQGAFGKNTALANSTNDGWIDYVANDLEFLYDIAKDEIVPVPSLPASGQMNKTYLLTTTGVSYRWSGTQWVAVSSSEAVGRAETAATNAQNYANAAQQSADDAQDTADNIAEHLAQIDRNTGGVSKNSKRISNIEKLLQGNLYDYQTDSTSAYTKTVPSGALPYAGVEKIGGKTLVWNQLVQNGNFADGTTGWSVPTSGTQISASNGELSISYDSTSETYYRLGVSLPSITYTKDHKVFVSLDAWSPYATDVAIQSSAALGGLRDIISNMPANTWTHGAAIITVVKTLTYSPYIAPSTGYSSFQANEAWKIRNVNIFDLTLMFGAGNEPTTVAEFQQMFPADYYPYNAGTLLSAGVTSVVSKDSNDDALQKLSIPAEVKALDGYGWSAGSVYNYIDFERKVFVKNVERADLGTQSWSYLSQYGVFSANFGYPDSAKNMTNNPSGIACPRYAFNGVYSSLTDMSCGYIYYKNIAVKDDSFNGDTAAFKTAMSGVYAYYPLATPVETDISAYLTDNIIEVGAGGTLTFENSNGGDYHIPVPSEVTYVIDLQEAVANG